jgi:hypothetical protein
MTPQEIQQAAQMRAMALRGQEPQAMQQDADALSAVGGLFAGWGGKTGRAVSEGSMQRGDSLRALAQNAIRQQEGFAQQDKMQGAESEQQTKLAGINNSAAMDRLLAELGGRQAKDAADKAGKVAETEDKYRKELFGLQPVKDAMAMGAAYKGIQQALGQNSAAGDMAGIFQFMKVLDPTSSVREGEYANAKNSAGVPDQIVNLYNQSLSGKLLNPGQRKDFLGTAKGRYASQLKEAKRYADAFSGLATQAGGDATRIPVGLDFSALQETAGGGQAQGAARTTVKDPKTGKVLGYINPDGTEEMVK